MKSIYYGDGDWFQWRFRRQLVGGGGGINAGIRFCNFDLSFPSTVELDGIYFVMERNNNPGTNTFVFIPAMVQMRWPNPQSMPYGQIPVGALSVGNTLLTDVNSRNQLWYNSDLKDVLPMYWKGESVHVEFFNLDAIPDPGGGVTTDIEMYFYLHRTKQ